MKLMVRPITWFKQKYKDWKEAFRIASDNGAVIFH